VDRVHSYRAEDATYRVSIWSDHQKFGPLRVATRRETFASEASGAIGLLEVTAQYSAVRFDAPFGDDIFHAPSMEASPVPGGGVPASRVTRSKHPDRRIR
jgi:hypothetical protein